MSGGGFNERSRRAWTANAAHWDRVVADGNRYVDELLWPATAELLGAVAGRRVLDVACGNGLYARRLAAVGAEVVGVDFSPDLVRLASERTAPELAVRYERADVTNERAMLALGAGSFDAAVCAMALFDMQGIEGLFRAAAALLKPNGRLVFSIHHPCFNNPSATIVASCAFHEPAAPVRYAVQVSRYRTTYESEGVALRDQPERQPTVHRSLETLLAAAFAAGFSLDGLREPAFTGEPRGDGPVWGPRLSEIPPVLVGRLCKHAR